MKNDPTEDSYINELAEWQEKQFSPGEYLGGKTPPYIKYPTRNLGYFFLLSGIIGLIFSLTSIIIDFPQSFWIENIFGSLILLILLAHTAAGIKILRKAK